tara:strand:+ start:775 stop:1494 length:720 start_codon:yes stop_codon:yes gene_type:complete
MKDEIIQNFWSDIDERLDSLLSDGYVKLPSIKFMSLKNLSDDIHKEMGDKTFKEFCKPHKEFIEKLKVKKYLTPKLYELAKQKFKFSGTIDDQYHIARKVEPGNSKEMFRGHFDSHLFTIVFPLSIPEKHTKESNNGALIYFPNIRKHPENEIKNLFGKVYYKKYASEKGLKKLGQKTKMKIESFENYEPLLFLGNTFLHTNYPVDSDCSKYRLTLLAHYFDPSPKYGVGSLLRMIRNR